MDTEPSRVAKSHIMIKVQLDEALQASGKQAEAIGLTGLFALFNDYHRTAHAARPKSNEQSHLQPVGDSEERLNSDSRSFLDYASTLTRNYELKAHVAFWSLCGLVCLAIVVFGP